MGRGISSRGLGARGLGARGWWNGSNPYDDIAALTPDLFAQFRYNVYNNTQVLFRDPACLSPVTDAGVHTIGGVKNPFTGAIILTQPDAGKRPLWMGEAVGAKFDGVDDLLENDTYSEPDNAPRTVFAAASTTVSNARGSLVRTRVNSVTGFSMNVLGRDVRIWQSNPAAGIGAIANAITYGTPFVFSHTYDGAGNYALQVHPSGLTSTEAATPNGSVAGILDVGGGRYGTGYQWLFDGIISEVAVFNRVLSASEISTVEGVLA